MNESVDLTYTTSNGTADSGSDYTAISNPKSFSIPADSLNTTITVDITNDIIDEFDETINVNLTLQLAIMLNLLAKLRL